MKAANARLILHEGVNDPTPISRVISLDWNDGPVDGVLQLGTAGPSFKFHLIERRSHADEAEVRVDALYPLPDDSVQRLTEALSSHLTPNWPVWVPVWKFQSDEVRRDVEKQTTEVIAQAGPLNWVIVGKLATSPIRALPVLAARAS